MRRIGVAAAVAGAVVLGAATAGAQSREQLQIMAELRMLQQDQQQLRQLLLSVTEALKTLDGRLNEQTAANRKGLADQRLLIEGMTDTVRVLRERADDTNVRLGSITQELEALRQSVGTLAQQVAAGPAATPQPADGDPAGAPAGMPTTGPAVVTPPPGVSPQRTWDTAWDDYTAGRWDLAIEGFETFLRFFPRDIRADDAQLNIGNSLFNAGRFKEAAAAYQRVISDYPTADRVPQAYYKLGTTYQELKQPDVARKFFEIVMKEHPSSPEYFLARQALDRLK